MFIDGLYTKYVKILLWEPQFYYIINFIIAKVQQANLLLGH
ncbi:hypothetical protein NF27_DP01200 [Candidatus Jidaibacter acanthamoeba]|uniref:Uncharacterized protein n=1 Tax=Candidatus Jidaibacter acanthamoebae TaxID=86105 RepID=A0A0C1MZS8_9RICK|nr:hypothetical protein NF27_DP01200 [Candidatus Jidaibacter acanthamoeba]